MGVRIWSRVKRWIKNRLFTAFWPIVQSRIFVKLRSLVSQSLVPLSLCGAGAGLGTYAASVVAFPLGYGALLGAAAVAAVLGSLRLYARVFPPQPSSRFASVFRTQRVFRYTYSERRRHFSQFCAYGNTLRKIPFHRN